MNSRPFSIIVCGGRNFNDRTLVFETLDMIHAGTPIAVVIQGGASGADMLGKLWAECTCIRLITIPADWVRYGRFAGPLRNAKMLAEFYPDLVVAFPGGIGTEDMKSKARLAGVNVMEIGNHGR